MKRLIGALTLTLVIALLPSCQKNYNYYRDLAYGRWALESIDGNTDVPKDTLFFSTATTVSLTQNSKSFTGQYQIYCTTLTFLFSGDLNLFQEWAIQDFQDSLLRASVLFKQVEGDTLDVGQVLVYKKF